MALHTKVMWSELYQIVLDNSHKSRITEKVHETNILGNDERCRDGEIAKIIGTRSLYIIVEGHKHNHI